MNADSVKRSLNDIILSTHFFTLPSNFEISVHKFYWKTFFFVSAGFNGCRSPQTRLPAEAITDDSNDHVTFDQHHVTSSDTESRRPPVSQISQRHLQNREAEENNQIPPPLSSSSSSSMAQAFDAQRVAAERSDADANQVSASKPRIWSIAEFATSADSRRKFNPTTSTTSDNEQYRSATSSSSSPTSLSPPDVAADYRSWPGAAAGATGTDDAIPLIYRKQFSDALASSSPSGSDQLLFPVAAVEALRWQMAAAACRAATAAAAAAAAASRTSSRRFDGTASSTATDGSCANTLSISALR